MRDWRADSRPDLLRSAHQRSCRLSGMLGKQRCFLVSKSGTLSNPRSEFATRSEQLSLVRQLSAALQRISSD